MHATTLASWRQWLRRHHQRPSGVWLISYKKASGKPAVTYDEAVCEALCWGWIDSLPRALDEERSMLRFAPRKARTGWSRLNKSRVARMIVDGRMQPVGLAKVDAAKADGSWFKLDAVENLEVPADLTQAFRRYAGSLAKWRGFPRSVQRGILEWILQAKRPETRARRVDETARLAAEGKRANQWRA